MTYLFAISINATTFTADGDQIKVFVDITDVNSPLPGCK